MSGVAGLGIKARNTNMCTAGVDKKESAFARNMDAKVTSQQHNKNFIKNTVKLWKTNLEANSKPSAQVSNVHHTKDMECAPQCSAWA